MNIPEEALNSAATVLLKDYYVNGTGNLDPLQWRAIAQSALTAALPHIRAQIAAEIRAESEAANWAKTFRNGLEHAAQTVEEGTTK